jgi:predicted component of type VI protein secretion system
MTNVEEKLQIIEERMRKELSSPRDAKLMRTLMETLLDIRTAFKEFNKFFKIDINIEQLEQFQPRELRYSSEWCNSLIKICEVLVDLYAKINKEELAEKWQKKLTELQKTCKE